MSSVNRVHKRIRSIFARPLPLLFCSPINQSINQSINKPTVMSRHNHHGRAARPPPSSSTISAPRARHQISRSVLSLVYVRALLASMWVGMACCSVRPFCKSGPDGGALAPENQQQPTQASNTPTHPPTHTLTHENTPTHLHTHPHTHVNEWQQMHASTPAHKHLPTRE